MPAGYDLFRLTFFEASNSANSVSARLKSLFVFFGRASKPGTLSSLRISWPTSANVLP